jgi:hypothetical protein
MFHDREVRTSFLLLSLVSGTWTRKGIIRERIKDRRMWKGSC